MLNSLLFKTWNKWHEYCQFRNIFREKVNNNVTKWKNKRLRQGFTQMLIATYEEKNVHNIEELQRTYNVMLKYRVSVATRVLGRLIRGQMLAAMNAWKNRTAKHRNFLRMNMHLVNRNTTKLK